MDQSLAKQNKVEIREFLQGEAFKKQLAAALPRSLTPERFVRIALTSIYRNPKLLKCTQESLLNCMMQLGAMGLEPDGRRAHLVPYGDQCTLLIDYKGIAELLRRNGDVATIHCDVVCENDKFEVRFGSRGILDHVPNLANRGKPLCAYSYVKLPDGSEEYDVMGVEEIESVRKRSRAANDGPWITDWKEMAKKTVFRRHSKMLPLSPETREALERDTDADALTESERFASASPVKATVLGELPRRRGRPPKSFIEQEIASANPVEPSGAPPDAPQAVEPSVAPAVQETAPEPVPLHQEVLELVKQAGFTEADMLAVMVPRKMAESSYTTLAECDNPQHRHHLAMCIEDWGAAFALLKRARANANDQLL